MDEGEDGPRGCTRGIPQAKMLFEVAVVELDRKSRPIDRGLLFDSRVVIGQISRNRLFSQAFPEGRT